MIFDRSDYEKRLALLGEREKELKCLYKVHGIIRENLPVDAFLMEIVKHIWGGWQDPVNLRVKITFENLVYRESDWEETDWRQSADIIIDEKISGTIEVFYIRDRKPADGNRFLPEEQKLLNTIAANVSTYIYHKKLERTLASLEKAQKEEESQEEVDLLPVQADVHWIWRRDMVNLIAGKLDMDRFGIEAIYLIGSVKNATSGPGSDIDLLVHFRGDECREREMRAWFEGWSHALSEINRMKTGYRTDGLIDLHVVTDQDIRSRNSFATMIGSLENGAKLIRKRGPEGS